MYNSKNPMLNLPEELAEQIAQITTHQISELLLAVIHRYNQLSPGREAVFLSLPLDPTTRSKELEEMVHLLQKFPANHEKSGNCPNSQHAIFYSP